MRLLNRRSSTNLSQQYQQPTSSSFLPLPSGPSVSPSTTSFENALLSNRDMKGKKKRDSQEMKYPPTSFGQTNSGWTFGRMRSVKGKSRATQNDLLLASEDEIMIEPKMQGKKSVRNSLKANSSSPTPYIISPSPDSSIQPPSPIVIRRGPSSSSEVAQSYDSHIYPQPDQPIVDFSAKSPVIPQNPSSPITPFDVIGPSSAITASSQYDQTDKPLPIGPISPRKLTKRRPKYMIHDQIELSDILSTPSAPSLAPSVHHISSTPTNGMSRAAIQPLLTVPSSRPLQEGAAPPHNQHSWQLNRNASCSTYASSGMTPSTDESGTLETPNNAVILPGSGEDRLWDRIGEPRPALSRASTFSYKEGDDNEGIRARESYFQYLQGKRDVSSSSQATERGEILLASNTARGGSPAFSANVSAISYTPTNSSTSEGTARLSKTLRLSTSNHELKTNRSETLISPRTLTKKTVAFEANPTVPNLAGTTLQNDLPVPVRPSLARLRSSSLGNISLNTNSVYSVGEVATATNAVVSTARAITLDKSTEDAILAETIDIEGRVTQTLASFENASEAIRKAFDEQRERDDWPVNHESNGVVLTDLPVRTSSREPAIAKSAPPSQRLPSPQMSRPPLSPILRSATTTTMSPKKLVSFNSIIEPDPKEILPTSPKRPLPPSRSNSFGRLWRRLSSSGSGIKAKKGHTSFDKLDEDIPPVPQTKKTEYYGNLTESPSKISVNNPQRVMSTRIKRSKGSLDLTSVNKENPDFFPFYTKAAYNDKDDRPATPSSINTKKSKNKKRTSSIPPPRAQSVPLPIRSDTPPVIPPLSPTLPLKNPLPPGAEPPRIPGSPTSNQYSSLHEAGPSEQPVRSFRKLSAPASSNWKTPLGPYTPPLSAIVNDYFRDTAESIFNREVTLHRTSLHEDAEYQSYDAKRRYRQSLVEIKDDQAFQATVEQLVKLESDGRVRMTRAGGAALRQDHRPPMYRTPSKDLLEKQVRQENIRAWFVTRELVQGERRYGRLLAKGVAAVQVAAAARDAIPPVPPLPSTSNTDYIPITPKLVQLPGHSRSGSGNIKTPSRLRRSRTSTPATSTTSSPNSSSIPLPYLVPPPNTDSPIEILLSKLPKLYALSVSLSERFEHDPSPYGVADAFVSMEEFITKEISEWTEKIGEIVLSNISIELNKILDQPKMTRTNSKDSKKSRRRISEGGGAISGDETELEDNEEGDEGRLRFADIIIVPIQRASRYKLLFQELSTKLPPSSHTSLKIQRALEASIRLASECDRCQSFDLNALRRQEKKTKKIRPVSVGPGVGALM
ncbi:uncharacterized protein L201_007948 [Kwoniella dendrophila CBS 6074]|uniref:DH domain-containing protein n=1 Tax=Kwoniella dendrophila CBS 6074 TaxID=1295534 RepID=A0AAX4K6G5_9TREE